MRSHKQSFSCNSPALPKKTVSEENRPRVGGITGGRIACTCEYN
jgi:hypothetical protein